jgi:hypothetical protein
LYECDVARFQKRGEVIPADAEKRAIAQSIVDFEVPLVKRSPANTSQGLEKRTKLRKDKQSVFDSPVVPGLIRSRPGTSTCTRRPRSTPGTYWPTTTSRYVVGHAIGRKIGG